MGACSVEKLECTPEFDMMGFMELSQETRVDGKVMNKMTTLWDEWLQKLSVYKVVCGKISYLLVWLPEEVETYVPKETIREIPLPIVADEIVRGKTFAITRTGGYFRNTKGDPRKNIGVITSFRLRKK